jgi:beta-phosphoglucomutase family hydrolase
MTPLALPRPVRACLFDLDGVLTDTAGIHAAAWAETFNGFLRRRSSDLGVPFRPFSRTDYEQYVDGRRRCDGAQAFLHSRGIDLPLGPTATISDDTVNGLANRKNTRVVQLIQRRGPGLYDGSFKFVRAARAAGLRCGVVSASSNALTVLQRARIDELFDVCVDGVVADALGLAGKPAPDTFLAAADALGVSPIDTAVFEDAPAGIAAGQAGGFGLVVGVDRYGRPELLAARGADLVVSDLADLLRA